MNRTSFETAIASSGAVSDSTVPRNIVLAKRAVWSWSMRRFPSLENARSVTALTLRPGSWSLPKKRLGDGLQKAGTLSLPKTSKQTSSSTKTRSWNSTLKSKLNSEASAERSRPSCKISLLFLRVAPKTKGAPFKGQAISFTGNCISVVVFVFLVFNVSCRVLFSVLLQYLSPLWFFGWYYIWVGKITKPLWFVLPDWCTGQEEKAQRLIWLTLHLWLLCFWCI